MKAFQSFGRTLGAAAAVLVTVAACDGLLPASKSNNAIGGTGPGGTTPGGSAVTRMTHETFFPIQTGAHSSADCNSCHGGFATFSMFSCVGCHEHAQAVIDPKHAGVTGYQFDSKACLMCHPQGLASGIARADHKAFPIDVGTKHATSQCSDCHTNSADKKQFSCVGCHDHAQAVTDPKHMGIRGYQFDSKACLTCHPQGTAGTVARADHLAFPIDVSTKHATTQCADCHTNPADKTQFACIGCHDHAQAVTDPGHANVTGYKYDSPSCFRCHANGVAKFDHATLGPVPNCIGCHKDALAKAVTTPASMHTTNNFPTTCESCHKSFTAWGPGTAMDHQTVGGATAKCQTCHLANFMAATSPFNHVAQKVSAGSCNSCHNTFVNWNMFVHSSNCYNGATGRSHQGATCAQCHTTADYKQSSCTACHSNRGTNCNGG